MDDQAVGALGIGTVEEGEFQIEEIDALLDVARTLASQRQQADSRGAEGSLRD